MKSALSWIVAGLLAGCAAPTSRLPTDRTIACKRSASTHRAEICTSIALAQLDEELSKAIARAKRAGVPEAELSESFKRWTLRLPHFTMGVGDWKDAYRHITLITKLSEATAGHPRTILPRE